MKLGFVNFSRTLRPSIAIKSSMLAYLLVKVSGTSTVFSPTKLLRGLQKRAGGEVIVSAFVGVHLESSQLGLTDYVSWK